jgi:rRNA-processing protein FCF1
MKMTIAITDANIFIDLHELSLTPAFFNLTLDIHTTSAVLYELNPEQQAQLNVFHAEGRLSIHNLQEQDFVEIHAGDYPKSLSEADKSVLHIANKLNACVLSSDKTVRHYAKNKAIAYHGMIWIFDQLVELSVLSKEEACAKLKALISINFMFKNNPQLIMEIEQRLTKWGLSD